MEERYDILRETILSQSKGKDVVYLPNKGNWGDALIRQGTLKFLADAGIDFREVKKVNAETIPRLGEGKLILLGGGGSWCFLWDHAMEILGALSERHTVIVFPSTYELQPRFENTTYFSRDRFESMENVPGSIFCHDMAFYLGRNFCPAKPGKGKGFFFRTDAESAGRIEIPKSNRDISPKGKERTGIRGFFRAVNRFETIFTDRLHVSIAGCLLGKEVHLYPGSYFKNRAVYRSSMERRFERAHFHEFFESELSLSS